MVDNKAVLYFDFLERRYDSVTGYILIAVDTVKNIEYVVYTGESRNLTPFSKFDSMGGIIGITTAASLVLILRKEFRDVNEINEMLKIIGQQILDADNAEYSVHSATSRYRRR